MDNFIHIISTRFNVPTKTWDETKDGNKTLTDQWLEDRFDIFLNYCLPSFKNQKNKNFSWLVFFDTETPEKYLKIIKEIQKEFPVFTPLFVRDFDEMTVKLLEIIPTYILAETKFLITTDIDNDDMLHQEFVSQIQTLFQPIHNFVIDLRLGYQLTKVNAKQGVANHFFQVASPFVSLVENIHVFKTVTKERHLVYREYPDIVCIDNKPLFIQYIHSNNLCNQTWNNKRLYNLPYSQFGISKANELKISGIEAFVFNTKRNLSKGATFIKKR